MNDECKILLPKLGESIHNATIVQWFKKVGEQIQRDEPLLEVSTDKVNSEIPSPIAGILKEICAVPDQEIQVGEVLAIVQTNSAVGKQGSAQASQEAEGPLKEGSSEMKDYFSPALLRLAREKGVAIDELERISGTGAGGRVTKNDLEFYLEKRLSEQQPCLAEFQKAVRAPMGMSAGEDVERLKMSGMRKAIAENMVRSFYEAPHATLIAEVDVTGALKVIQKEKEKFLSAHGVKLTITSFVARAIVKALQEFPLINSSLDGDTILVKHYVNFGIAVSVEQGLMVPVIKNCQRMNLSDIAKAVFELSTKARGGKLSPDDVKDGTITMTNFGMSGVTIGVPIIRYPEVAIVGVGAINKKVIPLEEDILAVRSMMHISLTFDHRVLDGMYGCSFLGALKKHLEEDLGTD